ncbi:YHS domain-containing protein [Marinithermus hydrothermalis]|uniref:YHS domain-containing protein n=1 Tax=Marinithermus hydrothermalis (strain DSM 14884 / JCM 11576 / T1) TaxID=869210 RepID=F2NM90_MARHT|nr:YHS domain-containing protein [Marinithermus hydrothermalis]AEB11778.1 YHS domain-containing protein [Marinithermus hydrothermalis DSM 14884]
MTEKVKDPVCGMEVDPKTASFSTEYQGKTYYFCCKGCKNAFDKDPEKYLSGGHTGHHHGHHGHGHHH